MKMKRLICIVLAVLMVLSVVGCGGVNRGNCLAYSFDEEGTFIYSVVYPILTTNPVTDGAKLIRLAIKEKMGAEKVVYTDDAAEEDENGYEILVGNTAREAFATALERLKENRVNCSHDFIIKVIGNQICITALTDEMVVIAADWFVENFCQSERSWTKLKKNYEFIYAPQFNEVEENNDEKQYLNIVSETDLGTYSVVIPTVSTLISSYAAEGIKNYYKQNGYDFKFYREKEEENKYEILLGDCDRPESNSVKVDGDNYVIKVVGTKLVVKGGNDLSTRTAGEYLLNEIKKAKDGKGFNWSDGYTVNGKYDAKSDGEYRLTWGDEFNGSKLDVSQWSRYSGYSFKNGSSSLGGTRYKYTTDYADAENLAGLSGVTYKKPHFVSDGSLVLTTQRISDVDFLETEISTYKNMIYRYGFTEIKAQLAPSPAYSGLWANGGLTDRPEMLERFGKEITRNCMTEIDLLENFGATHQYASNVHVWWSEYDKNGTQSNLGHTSLDGNSAYSGASTNNKVYKHPELLCDDYHLYSFYWDSDCIQFAFDGKIYLDYQYKDNQSTSIHCLMNYLILSVGMGNPSYGWSYKKDEHESYYELKIDYVRVYQNPATNAQMIKVWPEYQETGTRTIVFPQNPLTIS